MTLKRLGSTDRNLKNQYHRSEISTLRYFSKILFRLVPIPFLVSLFRSLSEFAPYALRHNLDQWFLTCGKFTPRG